MRRASSSTCSELPFHPETPTLRAEFNLLRLETGAENMMATAQLRPQMMRLTDAAANRIKSVITNSGRPIVGVRVGVKNGGCAGMAYTMEYAEKVEPSDHFRRELSFLHTLVLRFRYHSYTGAGRQRLARELPAKRERAEVSHRQRWCHRLAHL